jgi:8-hydroxy-5-deazaflavin:NADPH oxidoreductase
MTIIAFIGAGPVARQLAKLADTAGHQTLLSSRIPTADTSTTSFLDAAAKATIAIVAIPFRATAEVLPGLATSLAGKTVIDATNPLNPDYTPLVLNEGTSAGEAIASMLPDSKVVKAFNSIFADVMQPDRQSRAGQRATAFIASDHSDARSAVADFAQSIGFAPVQAGPLHAAHYLEAMAHLNIQIAFREGGGSNAAFVYHQCHE